MVLLRNGSNSSRNQPSAGGATATALLWGLSQNCCCDPVARQPFMGRLASSARHLALRRHSPRITQIGG